MKPKPKLWLPLAADLETMTRMWHQSWSAQSSASVVVRGGSCIVTHHTSPPTTTTTTTTNTTTTTSTRAGPAATSASSRMERLRRSHLLPLCILSTHTRPPLPHRSQSFPDLASAKAPPPDFHTESDTRSQPALFFRQIPGPCGRASQIEVCGIEQSPRSLSTPVAGAEKDKELTFSRQKAADAERAHSSY